MNPHLPGQLENPIIAFFHLQVLAGLVEERGIETFFAGNSAVCSALSFIVRTSNTFLGSLLWVDFLRLLHLQ